MSGHMPVLLAEVLEALAPKAGERHVDATFGAGGYTNAILDAAPCAVVGIDRDPDAVARGRALEAARPGVFTMVESDFADLDRACGEMGADGIVLDIGVSSFQLDEAARGFSFVHDGPLDMRMSKKGPTAADAVALLDEAELGAIFRVYGEEREARRVARAIVADRRETPFTRTRPLAELVSRVVGRKHADVIHPATRVFQALRIFVNDELGALSAALAASERALRPGGRLVVVSFHSLEDRVVKVFLAGRSEAGAVSRHAPTLAGPAPTFKPLTRKPVTPGAAEIAHNPRARSAKLRAAIRTTAPARHERPGPWPGVPTLERLAAAADRDRRRGGGAA
jgi:16S rRNA (cytosine1402-N4)-methyltransferase